MNNDNPLSGAEDWCAVEGTDAAIQFAYGDVLMREIESLIEALDRLPKAAPNA